MKQWAVYGCRCLAGFVIFLMAFWGGIVLLILVPQKIDEWRYPTTAPFDPALWNSDLRFRHSVLQTVSQTIVKPGMSKAQIEKQLGRPNNGIDHWRYYTDLPGWLDWMEFYGEDLVISFDAQGRVKSSEAEKWTN